MPVVVKAKKPMDSTLEFEIIGDPSVLGLNAPIGSRSIDIQNGESYNKFGNLDTDWKNTSLETIKEIFIPFRRSANKGNYSVRTSTATGLRRFSFIIPPTFKNLVSAKFFGISKFTGTNQEIVLTSSYAMVGEHHNTNQETFTHSNLSFINNRMFELDASNILTGVQKNHIVGIKLNHNLSGQIHLLGFKLRFNQ